jgi:hypothetical protein
MKKILVLLLILAVAGGVFALDGEWSLSGKAEIGATLDLDSDPTVTTEKVITGGRPYNSWERNGGELGLAYNWEGLKAYLTFRGSTKADDSAITSGMEFYGERYAFKAETDLNKMLVSGANVGNLWGYYDVLNDMVHLEAAYKSRWNEWWVSDQTAGIVNIYGGGAHGSIEVFRGPWDGANTWGRVDGHNFFLTNVSFSGLNFGIKVPLIFDDGDGIDAYDLPLELVEDVLKKAIFGFKFSMEPIEFAGQFAFEDYGVYFGGKWNIGVVTVGLSFSGILNNQQIKVGGGVDYAADAFGAGVKGYFARDAQTNIQTVIGIEPYFFYNVIPTHLQFRADVGFYFNATKDKAGNKVDVGDEAVVWGLRPQIFWNFLGTGAGDYGNIGTGMVFRYTMISTHTNTLDLVFKWSF